MQLSPEFSLAVRCCRAAFSAPPAAPVALPTDGVDWPCFIQIASFHRVEGLAWNALAELPVPEQVREQLSRAASRIAAGSLGMAAECAVLCDRFAASGISVLSLKGPALGALAYSSPAFKAAIDIDLLIDPAHLAPAADILGKSGYSPDHSCGRSSCATGTDVERNCSG